MKFQHISKIEYIDDNTNYYDLSVPKTNNYCLSNGMVVHNTGFGFSVQQHHIEKLPIIVGPSDKTRRFLIGDSIEGWADAIKVLLKAYTIGKSDPIFDYRDIRPKGARLVTAGGKAPGPDPLRICIDQIRSILNNAIGRKLTSLECHDIMCHIADAVLSGGIRRAAMISFFSHDDLDMVSCKSGAWWELNPQRGRANNSAVLERDHITEYEFKQLWQRIIESGAGEPGVYFTNDRNVLSNPCITGDALLLVRDSLSENSSPYMITMKHLVNQFQSEQHQFFVHSYNENTKQREWKQVLAGQLTKQNAQLVKITSNDLVVRCTPDHKLLTLNRGWVEAENLVSEDQLVFSKQLNESTTSSNSVKVEYLYELEDVYDITVEDNHNFFANAILVHNCVEATLRPFSFCNLTELNVSDVHDQEEFNLRAKAAAFIGTLQAGYTDFHYLRPCWKRTTEEDALLGVSMTGIASGGVMKLDQPQAAQVIVDENKRVAEILNINTAARTSLTKPSGTASLVVGSSSGIHAWHDEYYIRRMRVGKNEALYRYLINKVPELIEDCYFKPHLEAVLSIPQRAPEGAILRNESALNLLERVLHVNKNWIHPGHQRGVQKHNVSCTVSIKNDEWDLVGNWLWNNKDHYNGVAVLPFSDHTYVQAPYESCTKEQYEKLLSLLKEIDINEVIEIEDNTSHNLEAACGGGGCEI